MDNSTKPKRSIPQHPHEDEMEQLRVALEDAQAEATALVAERDALAAELSLRTAQLREAEAALGRRDAEAGSARTLRADLAAQAAAAADAATAEELRVAMEELQVFAEELEYANTALIQANNELDRRVEERTVELRRLNLRLHDSEQRLRLAQRYAGAGTWDWDIRSGEVTWSDEYYDIYGLDPKTTPPSY